MAAPYVERYFGTDCLMPALRAIGYSRQAVAREGLAAHREPYYEIHLVLDGEVHWWVERETYRLQPDSIYITKPGELHGGVQNMIQPCSLTWLQVDARLLPDNALRAELAALDVRVSRGANQLIHHVTAMLDECREPRADSGRVIRANLELFLTQILRRIRARSDEAQLPRQFDNLLRYIDQRIPAPVTIEMLCSKASLSRSRIFQLFDQYVGQSPISYVTTLRIKRAQQLLADTAINITDIAFELGFSSSQHFATAFRRHTGVSPRDYRKARRTSAGGFND